MNNIYAKILADSESPSAVRLTTLEIQFPKSFLSEFNTHRLFSRNFSSSRAIPNGRLTEIESFEPQFYGANKPGMSATDTIEDIEKARRIWKRLIKYCKVGSKMLSDLNLHKQWSNRPNDWHVMCKGIVSSTEWANFIWLRDHPAAQPEMQTLCQRISECLDYSIPGLISPGEYHLPYITRQRSIDDMKLRYYDTTGNELDLDTAIKVSTACCAQVSYRKLDESVEKTLSIYEKLVGSDRKHASAMEHVGTPIDINRTKSFHPCTWEPGVTHVRADGSLWSANFRGWIQHRQLIPGQAVW